MKPISHNGCPYHRSLGSLHERPSDTIRSLVSDMKEGVVMLVDSEEKRQALFAYRISQFSVFIRKNSGFYEEIEFLLEEESTYKDYAAGIYDIFRKYAENFFLSVEPKEELVTRLLAGIKTFHSFVKRAPIVSEDIDGRKVFPYKKAVQLANTPLERAQFMAMQPDLNAWETIFFNPDMDTSKLYLGLPLTRPNYRCPIVYSGEFREIVDFYYSFILRSWEQSLDKPTELQYFL